MSQDEHKQKIKKAAALKYDAEKDDAPIVVATAQGYVAEKMQEKADELGIAVVEDQSLAEVLSTIGVGDEVPQELYAVVAQVLYFVSTLDGDYEGRRFHLPKTSDKS